MLQNLAIGLYALVLEILKSILSMVKLAIILF